MKKLMIALLLCALICSGSGVFAEAQPPFSLFPTPAPAVEETPAPEESELPQFEMPAAEDDAMNLTIDSQDIKLDFDGDPTYSMYAGGYIQASFYAYTSNDDLYEIFMVFPDTVESGTELTPASCAANSDEDSGLMLFVSDSTSDRCYAATQYAAGAFPEGSDYTIQFTDITKRGDVWIFTGTVEGQLVEIDDNYNIVSGGSSISGSFNFSMDMGGPKPERGNDSDTVPTPPSKLVTPANAQKI